MKLKTTRQQSGKQTEVLKIKASTNASTLKQKVTILIDQAITAERGSRQKQVAANLTTKQVKELLLFKNIMMNQVSRRSNYYTISSMN